MTAICAFQNMSRQSPYRLCRSSFILRNFATQVPSSSASPPTVSPPSSSSSNTAESSAPSHFKITLRRSAISLGEKKQGTLLALGIHRRMQTVYHRHSPEVAGQILSVKELLEVENVPESLVKTKQQQTLERRAKRGYQIVRSKKDTFMHV